MKSLSERAELQRRVILAGAIIGFCAAQTALILDRVVAPVRWIHIGLIIIGLAGWVIFGVEVVNMVRTGATLRRTPNVERALNDEFVRQKRGRATAAAFWAVMIFQAAVIVLNLFVRVDAGIGAQATITVGVVVLIASFLYFDREDGDA